ncbi:hypothetical protein MK079_04285, partial [Candidatus Gracilibacteria bacterium]|nr:hypothetical protein [Candidatus Gracilibacteria bacterium]
NIENPINERIQKKLQHIYSLINQYYQKNNMSGESFHQIKIFKSYSFAPYIFFAFGLSYIYYYLIK